MFTNISPRILFALFAVSLLLNTARAQTESPIKPNDVIALVGGEDMVALSEQGSLELLLLRAYPTYHLRFRSLAWEGDTLSEQHRDLNYPEPELQLNKIGATVVIMQFGKMESFGKFARFTPFNGIFRDLLTQLRGENRRIIILPSTPFEKKTEGPDLSEQNAILAQYTAALPGLAKEYNATYIDLADHGDKEKLPPLSTRDGVHLDEAGLDALALRFGAALGLDHHPLYRKGLFTDAGMSEMMSQLQLRTLIQEKNRLWFNYYRPQNWAFLAGDRTNQPSSRDYLDPSKRWFPAEMEEWLPLVEAKEKAIDQKARELYAPHQP